MTEPFIAPAQASSSEGPPLLIALRQTGVVRLTPRHQHARGQLLSSIQGLLSVEAGHGRWVVPATHAVWIPPHVPHALRSHGPLAGWSIYLAESACSSLPTAPCVLGTTNLLYEAVVRAASWNDSTVLTARQERLAAVILDEITTLPQVPLCLPMPHDPRLQRIAHALSDAPDDDRRQNEWAAWASMAPRTLARRFISETGLTFTEWRQRVRLLRALELLAEGKSVTTAALETGYSNVSAFIALFRRVLGTTPGQYDPARPSKPPLRRITHTQQTGN
jgi:AraC-like DNA-binding protein